VEVDVVLLPAVLRPAEDEYGPAVHAAELLYHEELHFFRALVICDLADWEFGFCEFHGEGAFEEWEAIDGRLQGSQWEPPEWAEEQAPIHSSM